MSNEAKEQEETRSNSTVRIIQAIAWPLVVLAIIFLFRDKIAPTNLELSATGVKISFFLLQAAERGGPDGQKAPSTPPDIKSIQETAKKASSVSLQGAKVLWVDDNPEFNSYERNALEQLGVQFERAKSTAEAVLLLRQQEFQLVITDFARADDKNAGYTLLEQVKQIRPSTPLIIYSSSANPQFIAEAKQKGAFSETNRPQVLFNDAINAIKQQQ